MKTFKERLQRNSGQGPRKRISSTLLFILVPIIVVSIVFIILFLSGQAESQIKSLSANLLQAESDYNAEKFGTRVQNVVPEEKPSPSPQNPHISVSEKNIRIS
jgi:methyl-accepting chemotaxis protein